MKLESTDVLRFFYAATLGKNKLSPVAAGFVFLGFLFSSIFVIKEVFAGRGNAISGFAFLPLIIILIVICSLILIIFSVKKNAKKVRMIFTEDEIDIYAPNQTSQVDWQNYRKISETKKDFILSGQSGSSLPIPKRFFQGDQQVQEFRELVREKLGDKAKLRND